MAIRKMHVDPGGAQHLNADYKNDRVQDDEKQRGNNPRLPSKFSLIVSRSMNG